MPKNLKQGTWKKPKTKPPKAPKMTASQLAAKQGYKSPGLTGDAVIMAMMQPFMKTVLSGKQKPGKPKASPTPPVQSVEGLAKVSTKDAESKANPKNMPEVSSIPASGFGPSIKTDKPAKGGVVGMDIPGMAQARQGKIDGEQIEPDIDEGLTAEMEGFKPKSKVAGKEIGVT